MLKKKNLTLQQTQYQIAQEEAQARVQVELALKAVARAEENVKLAEKVYASDQLRFQKGILLPIELRNSESEIQNAQSNYLDAVYQLLTADLELKTATGVYQS
ncbi:MAG: TolC family protein [Saprospiraceae bacterium]|nr:TolC family protein [Saprospiraceae bacterium]